MNNTSPTAASDTMWFVNYSDTSPGRTTNVKLFPSLEDARAFAHAVPGRAGYILMIEGDSSVFSVAESCEFVEFFGNFEPSAQEGARIEALVGSSPQSFQTVAA
ncbi:hypothetical protein TK90_2711 (plasmid) [Thioalkalivibrio sp. K90mix]|uniref:hypothetical protein n=1 Tax=Thioalkalivibrio sp. (strain K90mix) TaxID=396595 RepID=UPI000195A4CE|nr:hypothetical protein [Thioalkalivibrio sp. K90mix]ADC73197.1 hypothetical protein TK90_2711 [Thioalkalivibrio sp. K90mix]